MLAVVLVGMLGLALNAYGQDTVQVKEKKTTKGDTVTTKTEVKDATTGVKAKEEVKTTGSETTTKQEVKGKNVKAEREVVATPTEKEGKAKVAVKKGAIEKFNIEWTYEQKGTEYITEYTIKDKTNKDLMKQLNLTDEEAKLIQPGTYKIYSTSPFTGPDMRTDMQAIILKDIKSAVVKKKETGSK